MEETRTSLHYEEACVNPACRQPYLDRLDIGSLREKAQLRYSPVPHKNGAVMQTLIDPIGLSCRSAIEGITIDAYPVSFEYPLEGDFLSILLDHEGHHVLSAIQHKWFLLRRLPVVKALLRILPSRQYEKNGQLMKTWEELDELQALRAQRRCALQRGISPNLQETISRNIHKQKRKLYGLIKLSRES